MSIIINELETYLQEKLSFCNFTDIDTINGVQVSRQRSTINSIALAVDSSIPVIRKAAELSVDMLVTHHGLYWHRVEPIIEAKYTKVSALMRHDIALCAVHLPLDADSNYGNNAELARFLGLKDITPYGDYKGQRIGMSGSYTTPVERGAVLNKLFPPPATAQEKAHYLRYYTLPYQSAQGSPDTTDSLRPLGTAFHGKREVKSVAIVSGGILSDAIKSARQNNIDMYICGDASHIVWLEAQEMKQNVIFAGHYFTEVWGVLSLGQHLCEKFNLKGVFIHAPTQH